MRIFGKIDCDMNRLLILAAAALCLASCSNNTEKKQEQPLETMIEQTTPNPENALKAQQPKCNITYGTLVYTVQLGGEDFRTDVTELCVGGTELSSLFGFEKFDCLETVKLSRNRIENLSAMQNAHCRERIRTLDLSFNLIEDVSPLAALSNLETLDLRSNQISSVYPLKRLTNLKKLDLTGNPLTEEQVEELRRALPDCEILF